VFECGDFIKIYYVASLIARAFSRGTSARGWGLKKKMFTPIVWKGEIMIANG
jgi:hypothetical protein